MTDCFIADVYVYSELISILGFNSLSNSVGSAHCHAVCLALRARYKRIIGLMFSVRTLPKHSEP